MQRYICPYFSSDGRLLSTEQVEAENHDKASSLFFETQGRKLEPGSVLYVRTERESVF